MEMPGLPIGSRRDEDIALDLMKFVAMTTSYGKTTGAGVGFQGTGAAAKPVAGSAVKKPAATTPPKAPATPN